MNMRPRRRPFLAALATAFAACSAAPPPAPTPTGRHGHLLVVGGGLDNDARPVFERLLQLAAAPGLPRVVVVTAATGEQEVEATDKREALRAFAPAVPVEVVQRETSTADTVAAIDRATALLFTGGDQARITARYRPGGQDGDEVAAMRRLLARGGVIAGCSAGDAMMGAVMLLDGRSAEALADGPQIGPGMGFLPWAFTDSHFFERDRVGRLVAALEASQTRLGIGVGEDAAVDVDLATGEVLALTPAESLLVDAAGLQRDGRARRGLRARLLRQGDRVSLPDRAATALPPAPPRPATSPRPVPIVEPGQNRQLASWRTFAAASRPGNGVESLALPGWLLTAFPDGRGEVVFDVEPR